MRAYLRANRPLFPPNLHFLPLEFLSLSLPLTKRNVAFLAPCSYLPARIWPRVPLRAQGFSWILFSKRNFPLRGNMDEFIDLDLRKVRKNLFFINLLNFIREEDLYKSYLFKTCSWTIVTIQRLQNNFVNCRCVRKSLYETCFNVKKSIVTIE